MNPVFHDIAMSLMKYCTDGITVCFSEKHLPEVKKVLESVGMSIGKDTSYSWRICRGYESTKKFLIWYELSR